jgi:hypothetical protein
MNKMNKHNTPKAPSKASKKTVPMNDTRVMLRQVAAFQALMFCYTEHLRSNLAAKQDAIFLQFNGDDNIKGTVNQLIDGDNGFAGLYYRNTSIRVASEVESVQQLVFNAEHLGRDSAVNFVAGEHITANWIATKGTKVPANKVTGRQLWASAELVFSNLRIAMSLLHKLARIVTVDKKNAVVQFASGKNETDLFKLINDGMYTHYMNTPEGKKKQECNDNTDISTLEDDTHDNDANDNDNNKGGAQIAENNLLSGNNDVAEDWIPFGKNSQKAPEGWKFVGYLSFVLFGPTSGKNFTKLLHMSDDEPGTTSTPAEKLLKGRAHQRLLEQNRANHQRGMGDDRGLSLQHRMTAGFMAHAVDEGDRRDRESQLAAIIQKFEVVKVQLSVKMEFWKAETDITEKRILKTEIDKINDEISALSNAITEYSNKKRKPNPIITTILADVAKSMGIGKGRSMSTTMPSIANDEAIIQAWEKRRPNESDDDHRHRRGDPPENVCEAEIRVGATMPPNSATMSQTETDLNRKSAETGQNYESGK